MSFESKASENDNPLCLIVVFRDTLALSVAPSCPEASFEYDNVAYEDQGFGDFTGFYDWLRNRERSVIGVRYLPADELDFLCNAVEGLPYASVDWRIRSIELYFSESRNVDESISNDQAFGDNRLFKSATGTFCLSFNVSEVIQSFDSEVTRSFSRIES